MSRKKKRRIATIVSQGYGPELPSAGLPSAGLPPARPDLVAALRETLAARPDFGVAIDPSLDPSNPAPSEVDNFADATGQEVIPVVDQYAPPPEGSSFIDDSATTYGPPAGPPPIGSAVLGQNYGAQLPLSPVSTVATDIASSGDSQSLAQSAVVAAASALVSRPDRRSSPLIVDPLAATFQSAYNNAGYSPRLTVDGRMGPATSAALQSVLGGLMSTAQASVSRGGGAAFSAEPSLLYRRPQVQYERYLHGALARIAGCNCSQASSDFGVSDIVPPSVDSYAPDPGTSSSSSLGQVFSSLAEMFQSLSSAPGSPTTGNLGAVAQDAYDLATKSVTPAAIQASQAAVTSVSGKAAHAAGVAAANGTAKVLNGSVPAPKGDLPQAGETARVILHGLEGAPTEVRNSVVSAILGVPGAQAGIARAVAESGGSTMSWGVFAGLAALGLALLAASKVSSSSSGQERRHAYW